MASKASLSSSKTGKGGTDVRQLDAQFEESWAYSVGLQNYVFGLAPDDL